MKRPNKNEFLKYGINAAQTLDAYDKYIDYIESQLQEEREKSATLRLMLNVEIGAKAALCKCTADKQEIPCDAGDYCMHSNLKP